MRIRCTLLLLALCIAASARSKKAFTIESGKEVTLSYPAASARPILSSAIALLSEDLQRVFGCAITLQERDTRIQVRIDPTAVPQEQGFRMEVLPDGRCLLTGHDSHGAAYGLMELSRLIGVSPWEWWADATPAKRERFELPAGYTNEQAPAVEYRGLFINDEDWGLMPWSSQTFEPEHGKGVIGPKTNEKIFQLMLRLRANYYWPAMHECSEPFFLTKGNREMAEKYGIYIGGSHCEPMASSTAVEWGRRGKGVYDYVHNREQVLAFWEERVKEVAGQEIVYTLGMRGVHDGAMNGAKTIAAQKAVLTQAIADQRALLRQYVCKDVAQVPQVFIPYKEVLDVYHAGLEVPDDVTLMWCDDNYGYIKHFPTAEERHRKGGNGIYYHVSYWGRPHDYLWLGTASPFLLYQQMQLAYEKGIRKMWILNVGDIKPAEYQTELFMDMAWNIRQVAEQGVTQHLAHFLSREFGHDVGQELLPIVMESYRLAFIRKPEFMGNTREEERKNPTARIVKDMPWCDAYQHTRLAEYRRLSDKAEELYASIPHSRKDTYFQLVKYPIQAAAEMNKKMIQAQWARRGMADWAASNAAYDSIVSLTRTYNEGIGNQGKWRGIMSHQPRKLPPFDPVPHVSDSTTSPHSAACSPLLGCIQANEGTGNLSACEGLGYHYGAATLKKGSAVRYTLPPLQGDSVTIELCFLPTHPIDGHALPVEVSLSNGTKCTFNYATKGRSEQWKQHVLSNHAVCRLTTACQGSMPLRLTLTALAEGIVLDEIVIKSAAQ